MNGRLHWQASEDRVSFGYAVYAQKARITSTDYVAESACRLRVMRMVADGRRDQN